ncbi:putative MFS-type transporter [Blattamonas nauphoetae]|uniref:Lysosomal dipeptide transporter MFSD1 n=1 Tax=Blattamonas nauphoetae TaxID=2049346 RepID=A0ABQ9X985_9EUKA|nr:putative MFS-type transporter [Blattamonas nauphoetae]
MGKMATTPEEQQSLLPQTKKGAPSAYRWLVLFITSMLGFGGYYVYDVLPTIQIDLSSAMHLNDVQYSVFYMAYSWTNCVFCLIGGPLVDRFTNRLGAIIFQVLISLGQGLLALGAQLNQYWLMIVGRVLLGMGLGNTTVVKNSILNMFFSGKELATAFGVTITFARIGSCANFFLSPFILGKWGYKAVLWIGLGMCGISLICTFIYIGLEINAEKKGWIKTGKDNKRKMKIRDICDFPASFWLMCVVCGLYHVNIFAMYAVIVDLLKSLFDYSTFIAGVIASIIYFVSIPGSVMIGAVVDKIGCRGLMTMLAFIIMIGFDYIFIFTTLTPIPFLVLAGVSYSIVASAVWTSISVLSPPHVVGTGNSIMTSVQMIFVGSANIIVGLITQSVGYSGTMVFFLICSTIGLLIQFIIKIVDYSTNNNRLDWYTPKRAEQLEAKKAESFAKSEIDSAAVSQEGTAPITQSRSSINLSD